MNSQSISTEPVPLRAQLYALLVGIDDYPTHVLLNEAVSFPTLRGCVRDAEKVAAYLRRDQAFDAHILTLTNQQATKTEIVHQFRELLGQAGAGDVALFYFSGHGTQERADSVWTSETDHKLECIACYYDQQTAQNFLLADKELRYLIWEVAQRQPHIVTIFDCCHSGDNTRNGQFITTAFQTSQPVEKRIPYVFPQRDWTQFVFAETISRERVKVGSDQQILPEGQHVQLSACESDESAVEIQEANSGQRGGVFTSTLLRFLEASAGAVTYNQLQNRTRQYLRNVYEQKPTLYVPATHEPMAQQIFLNKRITGGKGAYGEATRGADGIWKLNLGALHGIHTGMQTLTLTNPDNPQQQYTVGRGEIWTDATALLVDDAVAEQLTQTVYQVQIEGLLNRPLAVHIRNVDGTPDDQRALLERIAERATGILLLQDDESKAEYVVHNQHGHYYLTQPDDPFRPLTHPIAQRQPTADSPSPNDSLVAYLDHLSQWAYLKHLTNTQPSSRLPEQSIQVDFFSLDEAGQPSLITVRDNTVSVEFGLDGGKWVSRLQIKLTNPGSTKLYVAVVYLTSTFGAMTDMLSPNVYPLEPGNSVILLARGEPTLTLDLLEEMQLYNRATLCEHLQLIISTEPFSVLPLTLDELPAPVPTENLRDTVEKGAFRLVDRGQEAKLNGWSTQLLHIKMVNPLLNQLDEDRLRRLLTHEQFANFALGLYFDAYVDVNRQPTYRLKPEIQVGAVTTTSAEKGLLADTAMQLANTWARQRRNAHYKDVIRRFPNRVRIVSEGDSWFQHPLVKDIIDHLSRVYAIYCVAAAGDTLRNYQMEGEFLDALDLVNPQIFLLSGGGNDILGAQFRSFLHDRPDLDQPEGKNPRRFLRDSLFNELDTLINLYRTIFRHQQITHPTLHIFVHGYDYPVKLNDAHKGWLGRYMIQKGIQRAGDRQAIIRLIMDTFNEQLKAVCAEFPAVSYLDVRNQVRFNPAERVDQWYDEIHPNDEGFQQVAMIFMKRIDELVSQS